MGWINYNAKYYKNGKVDIIKEVISQLEWVSSDGDIECKVLKAMAVGSTVYAALQVSNKTNGYSRVSAEVVLTSTNMREYYNFSYKNMDESLGPCMRDCPKKILDMLTPTDCKYSNQWRKDCYSNLELKNKLAKARRELNKLPIGAKIKMNYWVEGTPTVILIKEMLLGYETPLWVQEKRKFRCTMKTIANQGYEVISL